MTDIVTRPVKGLGFVVPKRWPSPWELAQSAERIIKAKLAALPPSASLGTPDIRDQGGAGSCMGFSVAQGLYVEEQAHGVADAKLPSPVVPYWFARRESVSSDAEVTDSGSEPDMMIKAANDFGACDWDTAPYSDTSVNNPPGDVAITSAQKLACVLEPILATGQDLYLAIQHSIAVDRLPVVIGFNVGPAYDNIGADGIVDDPSGPYRGGHANTIYGYDETGALDANQWGTTWGRNGCCTMTPRFIAGAVVFAASLRRIRQ